MKLTGEYEFTENGVIIEGQVHDTKIAEVRQQMRGVQQIEMYCGELRRAVGDMYKVPSPNLFQRWKNSGLLKAKAISDAINVHGGIRENTYVWNDLALGGIQYVRGAGMSLISPTRIEYSDGYHYYVKTKLAFNVGWIYALTKTDGTFRVELKGLVNRHILTMLLGRATSFAKFIDGPIAKIAADSANLTIQRVNPWGEEV